MYYQQNLKARENLLPVAPKRFIVKMKFQQMLKNVDMTLQVFDTLISSNFELIYSITYKDYTVRNIFSKYSILLENMCDMSVKILTNVIVS